MALAFALSGCRKLPSFFERAQPTPPPTTTPASRPVIDLKASAQEAVIAYLEALRAHDYATAYAMLSRDAQARHTRAAFEEQGKKGMPLYDLGTAQATVSGDTAVVAVQQTEDPATHGFHLVREDDAWKIVYRGGRPGQPYAED